MRIDYLQQPLHDRLKWTLGPHHLFNSALVLGIIAVKDPHSRRSRGIVEDLIAYCDMQRGDIWLNEFALAEVKIIELCISKVERFRTNRAAANTCVVPDAGSGSRPPGPPMASASAPASGQHQPYTIRHQNQNLDSPDTALSTETTNGLPFLATGSGPFQWQAPWGDPTFTLFEPTDLQHWENVLDSITQDQMLFGL
jgi:hypothetical protein